MVKGQTDGEDESKMFRLVRSARALGGVTEPDFVDGVASTKLVSRITHVVLGFAR